MINYFLIASGRHLLQLVKLAKSTKTMKYVSQCLPETASGLVMMDRARGRNVWFRLGKDVMVKRNQR